MNMFQTSGFITKSREIWWNFAERNVSFETSSPFSFCSPAFFCMSTLTPNFVFFSETPKFPRFPAFQWFYSFPLNKRELSLRKLEKLTVFWCLQLAEKWTTNEDVHIILLKKGLFILPALSILTPYQKSKSKPHDFWNSQGLGKRCYRGAMGFSEDCRMQGRKSPRKPLGCPETIFEVTRDPNKKKPTHLPRVFFFASGGGLSGSISNEDESIILFVYVAFRLVTCC